MNHPYETNLNAKTRQADLIESAAVHRWARAIEGTKPSLWLAIMNRIRGWRPVPTNQEGVRGSLEAGKTA
jgi:hypothetical protein